MAVPRDGASGSNIDHDDWQARRREQSLTGSASVWKQPGAARGALTEGGARGNE
jgi:hypothetical protein